MEWIRDHPNVNCFNLYETALFFRLNGEGTYEGSPDIAKLVKEHWNE